MPERSLWRTAQTMVEHHGKDAPFRAAQRADALLAEGDALGCTTWKRMLAAIKELQRTTFNEANG